MGVPGLWQVLSPASREVPVDSLKGMRVAVDASIWAHQVTTHRTDRDGNVIPNVHIERFTRRLLKLKHYNIHAVFVFDGAAPVLKTTVLQQRRAGKAAREDEMQAAARKLLAARVAKSHLEQSIALVAAGHVAAQGEASPSPPQPQPSHLATAVFDGEDEDDDADVDGSEGSGDDEDGRGEFSVGEVQWKMPRWEGQGAHRDKLRTSNNAPTDFSAIQIKNYLDKVEHCQAHRDYLEGEENTFRAAHAPQGLSELAVSGKTMKMVRSEKNTFYYLGPAALAPDNGNERTAVPPSTAEARPTGDSVPPAQLPQQQPVVHESTKHRSVMKRLGVATSSADNPLGPVSALKLDDDDHETMLKFEDDSREGVDTVVVVNTGDREDMAGLVFRAPVWDPEKASLSTDETTDAEQKQKANVIVDDDDDDDDEFERVQTPPMSPPPPPQPLAITTNNSSAAPTVTPQPSAASSNPKGGMPIVTTQPSATATTPSPTLIAQTKAAVSAAVEDAQNEYDRLVKASGINDGNEMSSVLGDLVHLLKLFRIPYVMSPSEADAQCAYMNSVGDVDAVVSEDSDVVVFGAHKVIRGLFSASAVCPTVVDVVEAEHQLGLVKDDFVSLALLLGGDYCNGVRGLGPATALRVVSCFRAPGATASSALQAFHDWAMDVKRGGGRSTSASSSSKTLQDALRDAYLTGVAVRAVLPIGFPSAAALQAYEHPTVHPADADATEALRALWEADSAAHRTQWSSLHSYLQEMLSSRYGYVATLLATVQRAEEDRLNKGGDVGSDGKQRQSTLDAWIQTTRPINTGREMSSSVMFHAKVRELLLLVQTEEEDNGDVIDRALREIAVSSSALLKGKNRNSKKTNAQPEPRALATQKKRKVDDDDDDMPLMFRFGACE
eukprot:PhM_4_TR16117/c1_g1_i1/m.84905/K10846/ERCC5, XPG, RAD2; DNA excision repair protein ERCC-5